jgi:uncharacterized protein
LNSNRKIHINRLFQILYPLLIYAIIYQVSDGIFSIILPDKTGDLLPLLFAAVITLPFMILIYKKVPIVRSEQNFCKKDILRDLFFITITVLIGILLNFIITNLPITANSVNYNSAKDTLQDGSLLIKILVTVVIVPILEETLYRGIIAGQLNIMYGEFVAIIISALLFGIMHANIVQFIYAFLVGLPMGYTYVKTKKLWTTILSHSLLNLIVLIVSIF